MAGWCNPESLVVKQAKYGTLQLSYQQCPITDIM